MTTDDDDREALRAENARLCGAVGELTERAERAEKELEASRALHVATIESLPFDFWARDREGYCFSQNATTRDNWGDLLHLRPQDMSLPAPVIERWLANNERALAGEIVRGDVEYEQRGETRYIHNVLAPIRMNDAIVGTLGVNIDITEQRRALMALREAQKLEAVGQLTAGIAHNFNNMLMGVLPNLELAARRATPDVLPLLEGARDSARRAADLVRKLMTYAGRNRPAARAVEALGPLTRRAVELCRTTFDQRITFEQAYDAGATACVDGTQIEQAILNVLINARDALRGPEIEGPCVSISVAVVPAGAAELGDHGGDHVRVRIADNGVGMDHATVARVYEPFFTTKDIGKGTGLGLATTHTIIHEHEGFITCDSTPGQGTTFQLYVPFAPSSARGVLAASRPPPARGTETVLIVDDETAIRRVVSLMLRTAGYVAREAASGSEALAMLADRELASKVGLVILDVSMPGMSRQELRSRLREITPARVVYFTGYGVDAADGDSEDVVLEKPTTEDVLLRTVRQVLDR